MINLLEFNEIKLNRFIMEEMYKVSKAYNRKGKLRLSRLATFEMPRDYFFNIKSNNFLVGFLTLKKLCNDVIEFDILIYEKFRGEGYFKNLMPLIEQ